MYPNTKSNTVRILILVFCVLTGTAYAERGGFGGGGGFHGNGGYNGNNGYHNNNGYHGNNYNNYHNYNNYNHNDGYYNGNYNSGVVITAPTDESSCESTQVCNSAGQCWTQQNCD